MGHSPSVVTESDRDVLQHSRYDAAQGGMTIQLRETNEIGIKWLFQVEKGC